MKNFIVYSLIFLASAALTFGMINGCRKPKIITHTHVVIEKHWLSQPVVTIHDTPRQQVSIPQAPPIEAAPSNDYAALKVQYLALEAKYYMLNTYRDTLRYDSSYVVLNDSVMRNALTGRSATFSFKYPEITKIVDNTVIMPTRREGYIGVSVGSNFTLDALQANAGFLYRNKRGAIVGVSVGMDTKGAKYGALQYYRKLSFR